MRAARRRIGVLVALVALGTAACSGDDHSSSSPGAEAADALPEGRAALPASAVEPLVEQLPEVALAPLPEMRLADGLTPPTNRWFSGLVFGDEPQPVFPLPLAFSIDDTSFGAGLPQIVTSATNIVGSSQQDVNLEVAQAASTVVSAYDVASVTLETRDADGSAAGSHHRGRGLALRQPRGRRGRDAHHLGGLHRLGRRRGGRHATGTLGAAAARRDPGRRHGLAQRGRRHRPLPGARRRRSPTCSPSTRCRSPATTASYSVGADEVTTELTYDTADGTPAYGVLPHQTSATGAACDLGSFPTVYGTLTLCPGSTLAWSAPRQQAAGALDLSVLSDDDRAELAEQVQADVDDLPDPPADTYFGGKWAYRDRAAARDRPPGGRRRRGGPGAHAPHRGAAAVDPGRRLRRAVRVLLRLRPRLEGGGGQTPAFGSELFNDHHFHYGYFLYAAGGAGHRPTRPWSRS